MGNLCLSYYPIQEFYQKIGREDMYIRYVKKIEIVFFFSIASNKVSFSYCFYRFTCSKICFVLPFFRFCLLIS